MKYNQKLPVKVEKQLDAYIERVKAINWFKPQQLDRVAVDRQINLTLEAFGVKAGIEYRVLKTEADWDAAWDAAWGAQDLLASLTPNGEYKKKFPKGNFLQLVELWEMGLYPCGVIGSKFICYVPDVPEASDLIGVEATAACGSHKHMTLDGVEYDLVPHVEA